MTKDECETYLLSEVQKAFPKVKAIADLSKIPIRDIRFGLMFCEKKLKEQDPDLPTLFRITLRPVYKKAGIKITSGGRAVYDF